MKTNRLYLDIHAIQTLPPSNINRDDTGAPKTAQYGGVRRARVSSQSWKRAMRQYFQDNSQNYALGVRTLEIANYVAGFIRELDNQIDESQSINLASEVIQNSGVKLANNRAKALFFMGEQQARELAAAAIEGVKDKKTLQTILKDNIAVDIALFGRMVADDPSLNEDASSQVAHAISTHAVETEFDFFTAVDDLAPEGNAGAGMLGTVEYNSSTLYRYANVNIHDLRRQLQDDKLTIETLKLFVEAFTLSLPTGKVNTFANQTLPQTIVVTLRTDRPINLVSAFEKPVRATEGYVLESSNRLFDELSRVEKFSLAPAYASFVSTVPLSSANIQEENDLSTLLISLQGQLESLVGSLKENV